MPSSGRRSPSGGAVLSAADLARRLNLSSWSVSRAINGHSGVSEETRRRVLEAMGKLGFRPNPFARGLRGRGMGMIGICFGQLNVPLLDQKLFGLQEHFRNRGLRCLLEASSREVEVEQEIIEDFRRVRVDGVLLIESKLPRRQSRRTTHPLPIVSVDPWWSQNLPMVMLDRPRAMRLIAERLLDLGHRRFALLGVSPDNRWRWPAMEKAVRQRGLDPAAALRWFPGHPLEESPVEAGRRMATEVLRGGAARRPTAMVCINDLVAIGATRAIEDVGLSVPGDVSVVGFNNQDIVGGLRPSLMTIDQNIPDMVRRVGDLLAEEMALPPARRGRARTVWIEPILVEGASVGPAPL